MTNRISNLILGLSSGAALVLLTLSILLSLAVYLGAAAGNGLITAVGVTASLIAAAAIVLINLSHRRLVRSIEQIDAAARRLSLGEKLQDADKYDVPAPLFDVSNYINERAAQTAAIGRGDLSADIRPKSDADILGMAMQAMTEKLRDLIGTNETRDRLQRSVVKLLDEVSEVSAGDLTVQADVGPEITGEIAGAFNSMTRSLRSLISQVKNVILRVGSSADAISDTTEQLAQGSSAQSSQISRTTSAISDLTREIQQVSKNASLSAQVAADSLKSARFGTKAARENIEAMNNVRRQVQETAKRIKRLGERAQEIGQIVKLIDDLSDRTGLLALNASLQASSSGESTHNFAVVAEEVERLAERSNRLTQQISGLTQTINHETKQVVSSMEETIREVVTGCSLAERAGQSLVEIETVSGRLAELLSSISDSAQTQAKTSEDISSAMESISEITALIQTGTRRAAESVRVLVQLSGDLRSSVAPFRLPADLSDGVVATRQSGFVN